MEEKDVGGVVLAPSSWNFRALDLTLIISSCKCQRKQLRKTETNPLNLVVVEQTQLADDVHKTEGLRMEKSISCLG